MAKKGTNLVGGPGKKKPVLMMAEVRGKGKIGKVYAKQIANYEMETICPILEGHIKSDDLVVTDAYPSYDKLHEEFPQAKQIKSKKGANFKEMHQQIMNIKGALRGIHHKCSDKHLQGYLNQH